MIGYSPRFKWREKKNFEKRQQKTTSTSSRILVTWPVSLSVQKLYSPVTTHYNTQWYINSISPPPPFVSFLYYFLHWSTAVRSVRSLVVSSKTHIITHTDAQSLFRESNFLSNCQATPHFRCVNKRIAPLTKIYTQRIVYLLLFLCIPHKRFAAIIGLRHGGGFCLSLSCVCVYARARMCVYQIGKWLPAESWFLAPSVSFHFTRLAFSKQKRRCVYTRLHAMPTKRERERNENFFLSLFLPPHLHKFMIKLTKSMTDDVLS